MSKGEPKKLKGIVSIKISFLKIIKTKKVQQIIIKAKKEFKIPHNQKLNQSKKNNSKQASSSSSK